MKKVLITGASGFIGSTLVDLCLAQGYKVFAGIRKSSSRVYLSSEKITFIEMPYHDTLLMEKIFADYGFDYIFHLAGVTKSRKASDFDKINYQYTANIVRAVVQSRATPEKFIYMSSFAAHGSGEEVHFTPCSIHDPDHPNTAYGKSKLRAEKHIREYYPHPFVILRPTGVYGPRERDYKLYFRMINKGLEFYIGRKEQYLTFIYAKDLVRVCLLAAKSSVSGKCYFVSDGKFYRDTEFANITKKILCKKTIRLRLPKFCVKGIAYGMDFVGRLIGRETTLNKDKYRILTARNWKCDTFDLETELQFRAEYDLRKGVEEVCIWYKEQGYLD